MNEKLVPTNKHATTSLIFGILTLLALCASSMPIPFTGFLCIPIGFLTGGIALIYGSVSLIQIKKKNEAGAFMAWFGILSGGFLIACILCVVAAFAALLVFAPEYMPSTPFFGGSPL